MELKSNRTSPVLTDSANTRLGIHSGLLPYSHNGSSFSSAILTIPRRKPGIIDDVRSTLFDAMILSSPTHDKLIKESSTDATTDADVAYHNWTLEYPSALDSFEQIVMGGKGKQIALFLDYDGTLSPIVDNPDHAFLSRSMRAAVRSVASCFPTAIISGRSRDKVYEFVGLTELYYAGSHGMDIMGPARPFLGNYRHRMRATDKLPAKEVNLFQPASEFLPMINEVYRSLIDVTKDIAGAKVENNKFCVAVHYRNVDEKSWVIVGQFVEQILKEYPRLRLTHGRKVLEVRPVLNWDKGKAVEFLLESLGLTVRDNVLPIYVGDDRTDEDAFKVLREGNRGYGIIVSNVPKESNASYSLKDPSEVMEFLMSLVKWKNNKRA
ncbi:trehalose-phosphate phosphatase A [Andrographis paniculata]|uniref:trehalose-phosphate phosphatase A n=1 Tax=Andrographis paniculata TaxID=175694 RepID=UPI0021E6D9E7|nr:trehalose-phosphate phosphatase A [Andrographis paniculata]XP_051138442.1 trehalose-phosphate phosphatase A [Andrographis paniculata]